VEEGLGRMAGVRLALLGVACPEGFVGEFILCLGWLRVVLVC